MVASVADGGDRVDGAGSVGSAGRKVRGCFHHQCLVQNSVDNCIKYSFVDHIFSSHMQGFFYKRSCPSVGPSVHQSVRPQSFSNDEYGCF